MKKIHVNFSKPSEQQLNSLIKLYQDRQYIDAEKLSLSITEEFPKHLHFESLPQEVLTYL